MPKFSEIKQIPKAYYAVDVDLAYVEHTLERYIKEGLNMDPDFQRGHVWTREQKIAFMEFFLQGGASDVHIYFNCPGFRSGYRPEGWFTLVDGKQRLEAIRAFLHNEIPVFGSYYKEYEGRPLSDWSVKFHVAELKSKKDVLDWYIAINAGGTPHTKEEIDRVREMRDKIKEKK